MLSTLLSTAVSFRFSTVCFSFRFCASSTVAALLAAASISVSQRRCAPLSLLAATLHQWNRLEEAGSNGQAGLALGSVADLPVVETSPLDPSYFPAKGVELVTLRR